jgi:hypothetical protein
MRMQAATIPWYRAEDYARLKEMFEDSDKLPDTHDQWFEMAERIVHQMSAQGLRVIKVVIDPDTFTEWCLKNNQALNAKGRMAYANRKAYDESLEQN